MSRQQGITLATYSKVSGVSVGQLRYYCQKGYIEGAKFDRVTWQWRLYPPIRLLCRGLP